MMFVWYIVPIINFIAFIGIGHYEIPAEYKLQDQHPLQITGRSDPVIETLPFSAGYPNSTKESLLSFDFHTDGGSSESESDTRWHEIIRHAYIAIRSWFYQQENKGLKLALIVLLGCVLAMFCYLNARFKEFQQLSQVLV